MNHLIQIQYQPPTDPNEFLDIPVQYKVVDDTEQCIKTVYCTVDLPTSGIPQWLNRTSFEMVTHYRSGVHIVHYYDHEVTNIDAEFFRYKLYADIMLIEKLKEGKEMEHC
jgi:hypothetical protein